MLKRIFDNLKKRREKVLNGGINCIPCPIKRLSDTLTGIEQKSYILVSGGTKSSKTQITNFLYVITPLLYAYNHPDQVRVKIFYIPLEESKELVMERIMSHILYVYSGKKYRYSPKNLSSTDNSHPVPEEILNTLENQSPYKEILEFIDSHIEFLDDRNPTGIYKRLKQYADTHGKVIKQSIDVGGETIERFDHYEPDDPDEYVIVVTDHVSLLSRENGKTLYETIAKYSEYCVNARNYYGYTFVNVQQQSTETTNLDAFKANKIRPTKEGLADCKSTANDCNLFLGITNPFAFELDEYKKYNIKKLKGNIRFLELALNRGDESNDLAPLYFDGAVCYYQDMPSPDDKTSLDRIYNFINNLKSTVNHVFMAIFKKNNGTE